MTDVGRPKRRKEPLGIAAPLDLALGEVTPRGRRLLAISRRWREMVSPAIFAHARPSSVRRDVLVLTVTDPQWMSEISYFLPGFLEVFNQALPPDEPLKSIRLRVGALDDRGAPATQCPGSSAGQPADEKPPDFSKLPGRIRERLGKIEDPELRILLSRVATGIPPKGGRS